MLASHRPSGLLRALLRLPALLYRWHLGWLLGHRFLLLVHRGRKSGRVYRTVVEVIRYDPESGESVVVSGWGERSDWYRNIEAQPALEIQTGGRRYRPVQRRLAAEELVAILAAYRRRHAVAAHIIAKALGLDWSSAVLGSASAARLRAVAFRPAGPRWEGNG
jgi:deazaflavin-dependent oxidoreductase (nitroreductase family)